MMRALVLATLLLSGCAVHRHPVPDDPRWLTWRGSDGPGQGKHIVLIAADQEYRSEQALPMLARILADVLSWETGSFEFEDQVLPKGWDAIDLKLPTERPMKVLSRIVAGTAL